MNFMNEPAIIVAVAPAGPRDRLLTFLTRNQGGVRLYAKRLSRRQSSTTFFEPLQGGELVYRNGREGSFGRLSSFIPQRVWPGVRQDLDRTLQSLAFLELINICMTEAESQPELFSLLVQFLNRLESERRPGLARVIATLRLLVQIGFAPCLESCIGCRTGVSAGTGVLLSPEGGGVVCRTCQPSRGERTIPVTPGAHGFMVRTLSLPEGQARRLRTNPAVEREVSRLLDAFVEARTGVRPRSGSFIERLEAG
jgi:DNA repair protein RecO (recombination protein O)